MIKFSDLKLDPKVLSAIEEAGYDTPTPIQQGAIPPALLGKDVLGIAQTGTGKTASFTLPMITLLGRGRARARMPRSLVLCPTRELAAQVAENFDIYAKNTRLTKALLIGGVSFGEQDKLIDRGVDVLIATPGRLLDHFERGKLLLTGVQIMVVDEADRMLDMGFIPDIERIFQLTPFTRQTLFFSATMAPEIERITNTFLHDPERVEVARQATTSETITQKLLEISPSRKDQTAKLKRELLRATIRSEGESLKNAIIFCNRKTEVDIVSKSLKTHGFDAAPLHGDLDQSQRTRTLDGFRDGSLRFLVASDVAARGLDIPAVSHVFNFDLPSHAEDYVHRIGRTGRAGRKGTAISLATPADEKYLTAIEALVKNSLPRVALPEGFSTSAPASDAGRGTARQDKPHEKSNSRRAPRGDKPRDPAPEAVMPKAETKPQNTAPVQKPEDTKPEVSKSESGNRDSRRDHRSGDGARDRGNDRRGHGRNEIVGMGDHMPDFLTHSFDPTALMDAAQKAQKARPAKPEPKEDTPKPAKTERAKPAPKEKPVQTDPLPVENAEATQTPPADAVAETVVTAPVENAPAVEPLAQIEAAPETEPLVKKAPVKRVRKPAAPKKPAPAKAAAPVEPDASAAEGKADDAPATSSGDATEQTAEVKKPAPRRRAPAKTTTKAPSKATTKAPAKTAAKTPAKPATKASATKAEDTPASDTSVQAPLDAPASDGSDNG